MKYCRFTLMLLLVTSLSIVLNSPTWAILIKNVTTDTILFEDGFEENVSVCHDVFGIDLEDYDPVAPTGYNSYVFNEPYPYATQVCDASNDVDPGAFEGNNYLRVNRPSTYYQGLVTFDAQSTPGDLLHLECMIARTNITAGTNIASFISLWGNTNFPITHFLVKQDGTVCDKAQADIGLDMANESEWYKLEFDYTVGSSVFSLTLNGQAVNDLNIYPSEAPASITGFRLSPSSTNTQLSYIDHCVEGWEPPSNTYEGNDTLVNGDFSDGINGWLTYSDSNNGTPVDTTVTDGVATISRANGCSEWSTGVIYQVINVPEGTKVRVDGEWAGDQTGLAPEDMWWGSVALISLPDITAEKLADILDYPGYLQKYIAEDETNRGGDYAAASDMLNSFGSDYPSWTMEDIENSLYDWEATKAAFEANGKTWDPEQRLEYNFSEVVSCGQVVVALKYGGQSPVGSLSFDNITLTVVPDQIPGDANKDGRVDGSDVTILAGNWQTLENATWVMGDFNGDGRVDGSDVTILAGNWQRGVEAAATSVPEPSTILLILCGIGALLLVRRR